ncbi:hypothetical protein GOP47_0008688 [Adiantum capillus-veneris]|uniref:Uncharacterized protein n=1 Tax=Adiantum capillus-veneris TaxID=13818 RepID=A0A9D4UZS9_ADICA|nr:hypothetical protein GOP47_0008688 [Adiantum capillus-veneris]
MHQQKDVCNPLIHYAASPCMDGALERGCRGIAPVPNPPTHSWAWATIIFTKPHDPQKRRNFTENTENRGADEDDKNVSMNLAGPKQRPRSFPNVHRPSTSLRWLTIDRERFKREQRARSRQPGQLATVFTVVSTRDIMVAKASAEFFGHGSEAMEIEFDHIMILLSREES